MSSLGDVELRVVVVEAGIVLREHATPGTRVVDAPGHARLDVQNLHFQHVAGLGALDVNGARDDVAATALSRTPVSRGPEVQDVLQDLITWDAESGEVGAGLLTLGRPRVRQRVDANRLAGLDGHNGFFVDRIPAPTHGLRPRGHEVVGLDCLVLLRSLSGSDAGREREHTREKGANPRRRYGLGSDAVAAFKGCVQAGNGIAHGLKMRRRSAQREILRQHQRQPHRERMVAPDADRHHRLWRQPEASAHYCLPFA